MRRVGIHVLLRPEAICIGPLSFVAAIRAWLQWVGPVPGDRYAATHFATPWTEAPLLRRVTSFYSALGTPVVAAALVGVAFLILWFRVDRRVVYGFIAACLVIPFNALLKQLSGPTPLWVEVHRDGHNFPSGHVAFVTAVVGYLGWVAARRHQRAGVALALVVVIGMGPARVIAGAHLVSDVIAGYLVGGAMLVLAVAVAGGGPPGVDHSA